ncbi:MAG: hypothetical protein L0Y74_01645 [candidate division Zixibacteria bacterium]|nr:hypothetical protein [candidate division Zixibacteria bacterium]
MPSTALQKLEKKLFYTVEILDKLKDKRYARELSGTKFNRDLQTAKGRQDSLRAEISRLKKAGEIVEKDNRKNRNELRRRLSGLSLKINTLESLIH